MASIFTPPHPLQLLCKYQKLSLPNLNEWLNTNESAQLFKRKGATAWYLYIQWFFYDDMIHVFIWNLRILIRKSHQCEVVLNIFKGICHATHEQQKSKTKFSILVVPPWAEIERWRLSSAENLNEAPSLTFSMHMSFCIFHYIERRKNSSRPMNG